MADIFDLLNLVDISIITAALSIIAGVINSIFASRRAEKQRKTEIETRQAQLFMQLYQDLLSEENMRSYLELLNMEWDDYDDFERKFGSDHNPDNRYLPHTLFSTLP